MTVVNASNGTDRNPMLHRWLLLAGWLLMEYVLLSYLFDALQMKELSAGIGLLGHLGTIAPLAVVAAAACVLLVSTGDRAALVVLAEAPPPAARALRFVALNIACYAGFLALTDRIFAGSLASSSNQWSWIGSWFVVGAGLVISLGPAAMDRTQWRVFGRRIAPAAAGGAGVGLLAWGAGLLSAELWKPLSLATLATVRSMLAPLVNDPIYLPEDMIIGSERFFVVVAPECSGFEGLGLMCVFLGVHLVVSRNHLRFPRALWLLPVGLGAVWLGNSLRIAALVLIGIHVSPRMALGGFHSKAGWLLFCGIALALVAVSRGSAIFGAKAAEAPSRLDDAAYHNPTAAYVTPLLALVATGLLTGLFAVSFDALYGLRVAAVCIALWYQRTELPKPTWPVSWEAPVVGVLVYLFWIPLLGAPQEGAGDALALGLESLGAAERGLWLALRVVGAVVTVPIAEELAFRGFLMRRLVSADFTLVPLTRRSPIAWIASSVAFGMLHPSWVAGSLAGLCYALVVARRGRLSDAIVAHGVTNALIAGQVLLYGDYWLW